MKTTQTLLTVLGSLALAGAANAQLIAKWTFETSLPLVNDSQTAGPYSPEFGAGAASGFHLSNLTDYSNPVGNGSAESFSSNTWAINDYYQFQVSTLGYSGIIVSFDHASSGSGPRDFGLSYSTDGTLFTSFISYSVLANASPNPVWNATTTSPLYSFSYDLSSVTALNNAATVFFRLINTSTVSANGGTVAAGGTSRVDNFQVSVVPEPHEYALLAGLGLVGFALWRRRAAK